MSVLQADALVKEYLVRDGRRRITLRAVDELSFELLSGTTVALVGESGSGKSTVARMLAQLVRPSSGAIRLDGESVSSRGRGLRRYREDVQLVFQDPFGSLNPFHTVDHHLRRPLRVHRRVESRADEDRQIEHLLERVNLTPPARVAGKRPHELSGGQRQRIAIARALAPAPRVLLADEPVSMLDVSIRLEILNLIDRLKEEDDLAVLYITHDLATARHFSRRILVMYRGELVESGESDEVILRPRHPYTRLLASAAPDPRRRLGTDPVSSGLSSGGPESPVTPSVDASKRSTSGATEGDASGGCRFRQRCPSAMAMCAQRPPILPVGDGHTARCWLYRDGAGF
ncbi:ABC transporter ATP-binding protein [Actinoalloteichus hymeniacidonis]|uniref:ABC-type dipeptide/oligopeptide/nickel transport system, ATPase component n=1 Tax=Actinoalloteichus hymeniacidonis TaxID=340345 RepID=A0AAC9MXR9_9PSEU|nr:ABC transporter ATP-binding protein [Actinoalloteichus hymeniacidonis]AOS62580.1 ABC-type dipeptide/oligopeptide/nickel transport system, ATPase component [Actinoalloteichus hymeniacidonis]MBB5909389.1 peptide/nickel transport system ATP-binding protein [Actinoalloteichus hymeniacidonis]